MHILNTHVIKIFVHFVVVCMCQARRWYICWIVNTDFSYLVCVSRVGLMNFVREDRTEQKHKFDNSLKPLAMLLGCRICKHEIQQISDYERGKAVKKYRETAECRNKIDFAINNAMIWQCFFTVRNDRCYVLDDHSLANGKFLIKQRNKEHKKESFLFENNQFLYFLHYI